jgi:hypothetical protein
MAAGGGAQARIGAAAAGDQDTGIVEGIGSGNCLLRAASARMRRSTVACRCAHAALR